MNQVDLLIIVIVLGSGLAGARRGLINSAGDIISLLIGLGVGSVAYPIAAAPLKWIFGLSPTWAGVLGFILVAASAVWLTAWGCGRLAERYEPPRHLGLVGGGVFGAIMGVILAAVLLLASGLLPGSGQTVRASLLGPRIITMVPRLHENMDSIGLPLPKLVQLPTDYREELSGMRQGTQFLRVNFARLNGATCINCRTPVEFLGYRFSRGTMISPEYRCPNCGRTSDGCQTFEGFHTIYGKCPVDLANQGVEFDCGVWTNGWWTVPHGKCPVCGKEYHGAGTAIHAPSPRLWSVGD
jgi:uncharacterized membrane protein required for colicin V production